MAISVRLSEEDTNLFKNYAKMHNISLSELVRSAILEKIEDEIDLQSIKQFENNRENAKFYSLEDVKQELGFSDEL